MTAPSQRVVTINPLPSTLAHYESVLTRSLARADVVLTSAPTPSIEQLSPARKILALLRILWRRPTGHEPILVLWPALGYLDIATWVPVIWRRRVLLVIHDVRPLRRQFGYGRLSRRIFSRTARLKNVEVLCHNEAAAVELRLLTGVTARVVPHPLDVSEVQALTGRVVRVLGQYKEARSLEPLRRLADDQPADLDLQITGRGWPSVEGWATDSRFVTEEEFDDLVRTAACVVLPYDRFYQSGVAVRCMEAAIPLVSLRHPQIEELYGDDWTGFVEDDDWSAAVGRAISVPRVELEDRRRAASIAAQKSWEAVLCDGPGSGTCGKVQA